MEYIARNFNDFSDKFKLKTAEENLKKISKTDKEDFNFLINYYVAYALNGINNTSPRVESKNIYNSKYKAKALSIIYGVNKALEKFNEEGKCLKPKDYEKYLELIELQVYLLKKDNVDYGRVYYDSGEELEESSLAINIFNTNRKLKSLELDKKYFTDKIRKVNKDYYDFISITHDLINQNMLMMSRIRSIEKAKQKLKLKRNKTD